MDAQQEVNRSGVLLVGHGTRNEAGIAEFHQLAGMIQELLASHVVETAFLELATPDIATGIERLVAQGMRRIVVVPILLFAAGHAKRDIPATIASAAARHPPVQIASTPPLECHDKLLELSRKRFNEAVSAAHVNPHEATLLLVGRGSNDEEATQAMIRYAASLAERLRVRKHDCAFMAMARPLMKDILQAPEIAEQGPLIVQPHLLFQGDLLSELNSLVSAVARRSVEGSIVVTGHLGPAPLLAEAFADLAIARTRELEQKDTKGTEI